MIQADGMTVGYEKLMGAFCDNMNALKKKSYFCKKIFSLYRICCGF